MVLKYSIGVLVFFLMLGCSDNSGKKLPEFNARTLSGKTIHSSELKGKIVVLKVWATWCGSCVKEIPQLNALVERYKYDSSIVFIAITDDSKEVIERFLVKRPFDYQHIADAKALKDIFQPGIRKEIPKHMVVDRNMNIVLDISGESATIAQMLSDKIEQLK
jgi:thiol-disulfide isomerase/thioredoxin